MGQIVVDGRVYPSQATSPNAMLPPHGSPTPGSSRPPQQQSPVNPILQQQQQTSPSMFPRHQMRSPYQQQFPQNMQQNLGILELISIGKFALLAVF